MNTEQLEQIKARAEEAIELNKYDAQEGYRLWKLLPALAADVLALLAERERLAAELRELQWMMDGLRK
jgi:hypothetical protein